MVTFKKLLAMLFLVIGFLEVSAQDKKEVVQLNYQTAQSHLQSGKVYPVDKGGNIMVPSSESTEERKKSLIERNQREEATRKELELKQVPARREDQ